MKARSPSALVAACRQGETAGWDELLERYGRLIWSVAQRLGLNDSEAREVFQRTWLAMLEGIGRLRDPERLAGWIVAITRNQAYLMFSDRRRHRREVGLEELQTREQLEPRAPATAEAELERLELGAAMRDALALSSERCRELLELLFLTEPRPDYQQIAEQLGIAMGSIGPTRARCLKKLEQRLERMYQGGVRRYS